MPLYYFTVHDEEVTEDIEGAELPHDAAAHVQAVSTARSLAAEAASQGRMNLRHHVDVLNFRREVIDTVTFGDAVHVGP